jgi:hypothetical protein
MSTINGFVGVGTHVTDGIMVEPLASTGYSRQPFAVDTILSGTGVNNAAISFGPITSDVGTVAYASWFDLQGNIVATWPIGPVSWTVAGNNVLQFPAGSIAFPMGPAWASNLILTNGQITYLSNNEPSHS